MNFDLTEFQIRAHEKIIGHYRELLDSGGPGLSVKLRDEMLVRLVEEERQLALLLQKQRPGR